VSRAPTKGAFRAVAKRHYQQRFFLVLGVAAGEQSAVYSSIAAAAMTGRTASNRALASLLSSRKNVRPGFWSRWAYQASAQCGLTTSLKVSPNGVAHWACGAGASPHFAPQSQRATPLGPP
jgi:hypothetical protein